MSAGAFGPVWSEADLELAGWSEVLILSTNAGKDPRAAPIPLGTIEALYACSEALYSKFIANVAEAARGPYQFVLSESGTTVVTLTLQEEFRKATPLATGLFYIVVGPVHDFWREVKKGHVYEMELFMADGEPVAHGTYDCTQKKGG